MKHPIRTVVLLAIVNLMASSCQKEEIIPYTSDHVVNRIDASYIMQYYIDGVQYHLTIHSETEHSEFINRMLTIAEEGHTVTFYNESKIRQAVSKEVVTYSTHDKDDAYRWASEMEGKGYIVTITYDSTTNTFNCTARN